MKKKLLKFAKLFTIIGLAAFAVSCTNKKETDPEIEQKIKEMTLDEKIAFIGGYNSFNIMPIERLGIPEIRMADGPVGVRNYGKSTAYPATITMAAAWDTQMAHEVGKAIGIEARGKNVHMMLGPAMNIHRMPLCGRNFEYLGEDPFLAGQMAKEYTIGMQSQGVMACAKHYAANNQEFNRHHCSSDMDLRTLHEIYLPAFKATVTEGNVATVMTSYNLINGIHASQHDYLNNQILKGEWGFKGFIVSDWVSTYDGLGCAKGGLDLEMPSGKMMSKENLIPAIEKGELDIEVINDKIRRILTTCKKFGYFENPDISKGFTVDSAYVRKVALDAARGGIVLVKNESNVLPLDKSKIKTIAVIGPNLEPAVTGGGGSSYVDPLVPVSLYEAVKQVAGQDVEVIKEKGIFTGLDFPNEIFNQFDFYVYKDGQKVTGANADYYNNKKLEGEVMLSKFFEKIDLREAQIWDGVGRQEDFSIKFNCFFTPKESGYYIIGGCGDDGYRIKIDGVQIIDMWRDQGDARAKHDMFMNGGQEYKVELEYYQSGGSATIQLGAIKTNVSVKPEMYTENAVKAAKKADLVIFTGGFNPGTESEGFDRKIDMPYDQAAFINKIAEVNKNIIVVLNSGGNVEMDSWINNVKGLVMAWYQGGEGHIATAEILFGITNPSGKLPISMEYKMEENPCYNSYFDTDDDKKVFYSEGIFMGYRYWDQATSKPRYPFGFGLSYTTFEYSNLKIEDLGGNNFSVSVDVKNTGNMDGAEAVQLYVGEEKPSLPRPVKELKAFGKAFIKKGETQTIKMTLNTSSFSFWSPEKQAWTYNPGKFNLYVAASSADVRLNGAVDVK